MAKAKMSKLGWIAFVLVVIGGINWGLIGALQFNLVNWLVGTRIVFERLIYTLVGISAIYSIVTISKR